MKGISSNRNSKKEEPYLSGTLKTVTLFKSVKAYHALLLFDRIILFDSLDEYNTKPTKPVYKLQLSDASVSKQDDMTFKLESKTIREIFTCENEL